MDEQRRKRQYLEEQYYEEKNKIHHAMEQSDHLIYQEGNRYRQQLEEKEREWTRTYQKELDKL